MRCVAALWDRVLRVDTHVDTCLHPYVGTTNICQVPGKMLSARQPTINTPINSAVVVLIVQGIHRRVCVASTGPKGDFFFLFLDFPIINRRSG